MTSPVPSNNYAQAFGTSSTATFITIIMARAPTGNDGPQQGLQITQRWVDSSDDNAEYFLLSYISTGGVVQANWVQLSSGSGTTETLSGNSGTASPVAGNINVVGNVGSGIATAASGDTLTATLANIPNGSLTNSAITLVAGSGISITTSPVSLGGSTTISATAAGFITDLVGNTGGNVPPTAGIVNVVGDGTTINVAGNPGTSTLTISSIVSQGVTTVARQVFTTTGTYTPTAGMLYCDIEVLGGGGGSGGLPATVGLQSACSGGGGGGGYARGIFSAGTIGVSQAVTVGAAGAAGAAGNNPGGAGGTTSVGALLSATGGGGGGGAGVTTAGNTGLAAGGVGGVGTGGDFRTVGGSGGWAFDLVFTTTFGVTAFGGSSFFGGGGASFGASTSFGGGGGGVTQGRGTFPNNPGLAGFAGIVIVTEYIS